MSKLNIGSEIVIIDCTWNLNQPFTISSTYTIVGIDENRYTHFLNRYMIINDSNNHSWLYRSQFMEISEYRQYILNEIINTNE